MEKIVPCSFSASYGYVVKWKISSSLFNLETLRLEKNSKQAIFDSIVSKLTQWIGIIFHIVEYFWFKSLQQLEKVARWALKWDSRKDVSSYPTPTFIVLTYAVIFNIRIEFRNRKSHLSIKTIYFWHKKYEYIFFLIFWNT